MAVAKHAHNLYVRRRQRALLARNGTAIRIRHEDLLAGPVPEPSPPGVIMPRLAEYTRPGSTTLTIICDSANGRLIENDRIELARDPTSYVVQHDVAAASDTFVDVPIRPGLRAGAPANAAVQFAFWNEQDVLADVATKVQSQQAGSGTVTTLLRITVPADLLRFVPLVGDRVFIGGLSYIVATIAPIFAWGGLASYSMQVA